jgi:hypothetical protein
MPESCALPHGFFYCLKKELKCRAIADHRLPFRFKPAANSNLKGK